MPAKIHGANALVRAMIIEALASESQPLTAYEVSQLEPLRAIKADPQTVQVNLARMTKTLTFAHPIRRIEALTARPRESKGGPANVKYKYYHTQAYAPSGDDIMTPAKRQALLKGQTELARKIYALVPETGPRTAGYISGRARQLGVTNAATRVIHGCLSALARAGLVRENSRGEFIRVRVTESHVTEDAAPAIEDAIPTPITLPPVVEPSPVEVMREPEPSEDQAPEAKAGESVDPIAMLGELAEQMSQAASQVEQLATGLRVLARRTEDAALTLGAQQERDARTVNLVRQFREFIAQQELPAGNP